MDRKEAAKHKEKAAGRRLLEYGIMSVAAVFYAAGISLFLDPNMMAPGGVSGIAIILNKVVGGETGTWILVMNVPILFIGAWKFGMKFMLSTIYCTILSSGCINALSGRYEITKDPILAAVAGGSLMAVGIGMILKQGSTTGGMDIVVKLLRRKYPYLKTGSLMLCLDIIVVSLSAIAFGNLERAMYAGISVGVTSIVVDLVLYGRDGAKLIYIISDKPGAIANRLLEEVDIGVTYLEGAGAYSGKEKQVIFCVLKKQLAPKVEAIVKEEDPGSFMIVTKATEIYGKGYKSYFGQKY